MLFKRVIARRILLILLGGIVTWKCTDNPFFDDNDIVPEKKWIKGSAFLEGGEPATGAVVWFEGYDVGCRVDEEGAFRLQLVNSGTVQSGAENGVFGLFVYVNNYQYQRFEVVIANGMVMDGQGDIDQHGFLKETVVLRELMTVNIKSYYLFDAKHNDSLLVSDVYCHIERPPVEVQLRGSKGETFILKPGETGVQSLIIQGGTDLPLYPILYYQKDVKISNVLVLNGRGLPMGEYQHVPWMIVKQLDIPDGLKEFIDYDFQGVDGKYLNLPFIRTGGKFRIEHAPGEGYLVTEL